MIKNEKFAMGGVAGKTGSAVWHYWFSGSNPQRLRKRQFELQSKTT